MRQLIFIGCFLGAACSGANTRNDVPAQSAAGTEEADTAKMASDIRRLSEEHAKAVEAKDSAKVGSIYADDAWYLPADDEALEGGDELRRIWHRALTVPGFTIRYEPKEITVAQAGDLAVERGSIANTIGRKSEPGHYIYVWQRRGGEWKVTDYMWSTRPPTTK